MMNRQQKGARQGLAKRGGELFLCELYQSVQGEGLLTGTDCVFVRTSGCNLRCDFCDTPWSSWQPEGRHETIEAIVQQVLALESQHVVLTGGEPMLQRDVVPLTKSLTEAGLHITIETAGTVDRPVACDLMSISPKLSNSTPGRQRAGRWSDRHEATRSCPTVIMSLLKRYEFQIKFVVDQPKDCDEILQWLECFPQIPDERVLMMPQGIEQSELEKKESWIREFCERHGFLFCPRMHIVWFGNQRGT